MGCGCSRGEEDHTNNQIYESSASSSTNSARIAWKNEQIDNNKKSKWPKKSKKIDVRLGPTKTRSERSLYFIFS